LFDSFVAAVLEIGQWAEIHINEMEEILPAGGYVAAAVFGDEPGGYF
jgi:hypothetical protein